jgi:hypothetical protein
MQLSGPKIIPANELSNRIVDNGVKLQGRSAGAQGHIADIRALFHRRTR